MTSTQTDHQTLDSAAVRVAVAAINAGHDVISTGLTRAVDIYTGTGDEMHVSCDRAGRLTSAAWRDRGSHRMTMPAFELEPRVLKWIERHQPDTSSTSPA